MSQLLEDLTSEENENDKPIPLDMVKYETFEKILVFSKKADYDDRKEVK